MKLAVFWLIAMLWWCPVSAADTTLTRTTIGGGIAAGVNMHNASFSRLTSFPTCCPEYTSGIGFHLGYSLHLSYRPESLLFGMPFSYGVRAGAASFSGVLTDDEDIGFVINGSTITNGVSRHTLDAIYTTAGIEPYLQVDRLFSTNLVGSVGLLTGFPVSAKFDQKEELILPADDQYTFESGSKTRGIYAADIPDAASPYLAATLGLGYMLDLDTQRSIEPRIEAVVGLTDVSSAVSWGVTSYRIGMNVHYRIAKPEQPKTLPVEEKRAPVLVSKLLIPQLQQQSLSDIVTVDVTTEYLDAAPIMFFEKNSTVVVEGSTNAVALQQQVASAISTYMAEHPEVKLTLVGSAAFDEEQVIARERVSFVTRLIGLPVERLEMRTVKQTAAEYPELAEEHRSVQFLVNGRSQIFRVARTRDSIVRVNPLTIPVGHVVTCDVACSSNVTASIGGRVLLVTGNDPTYSLVIDSLALRTMSSGNPVVVKGLVTFGDYTAKSEEQILYTNIMPKVTRSIVPVTSVSNSQASATLCYFEFNASTITSFNDLVLADVQNAIVSGKQVELIAMTDHLGTGVQNAVLAERRAAAASEKLQTLGIPKEAITIRTYQSEPSENATPMERISNRTVRIRIRD